MDVQRLKTTVALLLMAFTLSACSNNKESPPVETVFPKASGDCVAGSLDNRFIVRWKDGSVTIEKAIDREAFTRDFVKPNIDQIERVEHDRVITLDQPKTQDIDDLDAPDDYGLKMIEAEKAWAEGADGNGLRVAVVDSGVDILHQQLRHQIAYNDKEIPGNGVDDDKNGYIDDYAGYDFYENSGAVKDGTGHGTHVSGIILADPFEGPVHGVAPKAKLIPLDFMNDLGQGSLGSAILAVRYAVSRGARVINASWGGDTCTSSFKSELGSLASRGVLFVSAAGNGDSNNVGYDISSVPVYPAAFGFAGQIVVGAHTSRGYQTGFSNYSDTLVHLFAPGSYVLSTTPGNDVGYASGTSMATPFVSGAAVALWSLKPQATLSQIKEALIAGAVPNNSISVSRGRLNMAKAVEALKSL